MDDETPTTPKKINAMEARRTFGTTLETVFYKGDIFIIERAGKPMAALVPLSRFGRLAKKIWTGLSMTHKKETNVNHIKGDPEAYYS